jgi:hypothetical protein
MYRNFGAVGYDLQHFSELTEVEPGRDALRVDVECQCNSIDITRPFTVPGEADVGSLCSREQRQLGRRTRCS